MCIKTERDEQAASNTCAILQWAAVVARHHHRVLLPQSPCASCGTAVLAGARR